jgi:hypothetical protein
MDSNERYFLTYTSEQHRHWLSELFHGFSCVVYGVMEMSCTVFNEFGRMLPMVKSDLDKSPSRIKCERGPDKKTECRNYCACGIMSKCTAGPSWREHRECKFSRKSSSGDRCMYYRDTFNGHCDCVNAQRELKITNNRWCSKRKRGLDLPMEFSVRTHHHRKGKIKISISWGVGVFFSRQDDRPGASKGQRAIAAEKGKTRRRFLFEWKF